MNVRTQLFRAVALTIAGAAALFAGDVRGRVIFDGSAPKPVPLQLTSDPVCRRAHPDPLMSETVVVNPNGTLANVIVYVKGTVPGQWPVPADRQVFDQEGCRYIPHVLSLTVGEQLEVRNSDPTLHNVHGLSKENPPFNVAQPQKGMRSLRTFDKEEFFRVKCDIHPWMSAFVGVFANPFHAVTGKDGTFLIKGLPPGDYTIEAWHEKFGVRSAKVSVSASGVVTTDLHFKG